MPEYRQNLATKEWVILSPERGRRPSSFAPTEESTKSLYSCPFCPGNEGMTPAETFSIKNVEKNSENWSVRAFANKYPALSVSRKKKAKENKDGKKGFFKQLEGVGYHEVIIETPKHSQLFQEMSDRQLKDLMSAYVDRYKALARKKGVFNIVIFKNSGKEAGCSMEHPHTQIIASTILPKTSKDNQEIAKEYYSINKRCLYCRLIEEEKKEESRIVLETKHFLAFHPFASAFPYETWIVPLRHKSCFGDITHGEVCELGRVLRSLIRTLHFETGKTVDYNYMLHSSLDKNSTDTYHWYIQLVPKLTVPAGFELATGMNINTVLPEETAKIMRSKISWY